MMTRTQALRQACREVSMGAWGGGWVVYMPWRWDEPAITTTEPGPWQATRQHMSDVRLYRALTLLDVSAEDAATYAYSGIARGGRLADRLRWVLFPHDWQGGRRLSGANP